MTEHEWLTCADPVAMLAQLAVTPTDRRLRLFLVGCGRALFPLLPFPTSRRAVEVTEAYLDGLDTADELSHAEYASECLDGFFSSWDERPRHPIATAAMDAVWRIPRQELKRIAGCGPTPLPADRVELLALAAHFASYVTCLDRVIPYPQALYKKQRFLSVPLLRCIFGNPFRPVAVDLSWLTADAVGLANAIYDARAFHNMPILADALQDAGCDDATVLDHCRGPGPHVRGCWVVDLLLGK